MRKEAILSSQIEGTQASLNDVLDAEAKMLKGPTGTDVDEVLNYISAMRYGQQRVKKLPISVRLIREKHERLLHGVRGGKQSPDEIRTWQNWIGPQGCTLRQATFVPPPPSEVMDHLDALETFLHQEHKMAALIEIGHIHAQFETIHTFLDGNGRLGRLLVTFLLSEREILSQPVLYLSHYFKKYRSTYYDMLQSTRDDGDWEGWLKSFLAGVAEVANEATETARKIVALRENHRAIIQSEFGRSAGNGLELLEHLYLQPVICVNEAASALKLSFNGANDIVKKFEDIELIIDTNLRKGSLIGPVA